MSTVRRTTRNIIIKKIDRFVRFPSQIVLQTLSAVVFIVDSIEKLGSKVQR